MKVEIYQISSRQFEDMLGEYPDRVAAMEAAKWSDEIVVGIYNNQPICFVGLAPRTLISGTVYIWMIVTKFGENHRFLLARYSRTFIKIALLKYNSLIGHCFNETAVRWLTWLGAEFIDNEFKIGRG